MDERDNRTARGSGAASRPPESGLTEDTPLFTDIPYTPNRRTGNNGRPSSASPAGVKGRSPDGEPLFGARNNRAPVRPDPGTRQASASARPGRSGRTAPVYTELSWDDLMRGADVDRLGRSPESSRPADRAAFPGPAAQPRSGSQYFGGFDQEMEELFYDRSRQPASNRPEPERAPATDPASASSRVYERRGPSRSGSPRSAAPSAPAYPPQSTPRRAAAPRTNTPAPARRAAASSARPQWNSVFGPSSGQKPSNRQPARSSAPARPASDGRTGPGSRRPSFGRIPPLFLGGGLVLVALLVFLIARLTGDSSASPRPASAPANLATAVPVSSLQPSATPESPVETTPAPTPEPTPTPSGPKAKKVGELIVPADWGPSIPARSRAVYDSFFDQSCMVGNSLVEGFRNWAGMNNLRCVFHTGATVSNAIGNIDLAPITLNPSGYYDNIYLMFGLNEIGTDVNSFVQGYKKLVDFIRQYQPTANIICISVTPVMKQVDEDPNEVQSMDRIRNFNAALQEFCVDQNCWYLDIYNLLLDQDGYLSKDYAYIGDGKHFEKSGYVAWANYMKTHYVDEKLLTE